MDKAETNLGHGQRLDKLWTKFGQTLDKDWTLRPEFVQPTILQECQISYFTCEAKGLVYRRMPAEPKMSKLRIHSCSE